MSSIEMSRPGHQQIPKNPPRHTHGSLAKDRILTVGKVAGSCIGLVGTGSGLGTAIEYLAKGQVTVLGPLAGGGLAFVVMTGAIVVYMFTMAPVE